MKLTCRRYIKELADRINNIEGKFGIGKDGLDVRRPSQEPYMSPVPADDSRKRPFSSLSTDAVATPTPPRQVSWVTENRPIRPHNPEYRAGYTVNDLAPKPATPAALPDANDVSRQAPPVAVPSGISPDGMAPNGLARANPPRNGFLESLPQSIPQHDLPQDNIPLEMPQANQVREIEDSAFA